MTTPRLLSDLTTLAAGQRMRPTQASALDASKTAITAAVAAPGTVLGNKTFDGLDRGNSLRSGSARRSPGALADTASDLGGFYGGKSADDASTHSLRSASTRRSGFAAGMRDFGANRFGSKASGARVNGEAIGLALTKAGGDPYSSALRLTHRTRYFGRAGGAALLPVGVDRAEALPSGLNIDNLTQLKRAAPSNMPAAMSQTRGGLDRRSKVTQPAAQRLTGVCRAEAGSHGAAGQLGTAGQYPAAIQFDRPAA